MLTPTVCACASCRGGALRLCSTLPPRLTRCSDGAWPVKAGRSVTRRGIDEPARRWVRMRDLAASDRRDHGMHACIRWSIRPCHRELCALGRRRVSL